MEAECEWCKRWAELGWVRVPETVHPDQQIIACGECCRFVMDVLRGSVFYVEWWNQQGRT